jgi:hypothetical protein
MHEKEISPVIENREKSRFDLPINNINQSARYIRIQVLGQKTCPQWHSANGEHCWLFVDEIIID